VSNEFQELGLSVTTRDAGNDGLDSDFDVSPCSYGVTVSANKGAVRDLGLIGGTTNPVQPVDPQQPAEPVEPTNPANPDTANRISGFVWLDSNSDGLQSIGEPGFEQTIAGFETPSVALYSENGGDLIGIAFLGENSGGLYQFNNVSDGNYFLCVSNEFQEIGLSVTAQNAGDDALDSDFDVSPCVFAISVNANQSVKRDLGLIGVVITPVQPPVTPAATNRIEGTVWQDRNGDGIRQPENIEFGIDGISLTLFRVSGNNGLESAIAGTISSILIGGESIANSNHLDKQGGFYVFPKKPVGNYRICAFDDYTERNAHVTLPDVGDKDALDNDFDNTGCTKIFTITAEQGATLDLGLVAEPGVIEVHGRCDFDAAIRAASYGILAGGCSAGINPGEDTIILDAGSRHSSVSFPAPQKALFDRIIIEGNGALIDKVTANVAHNANYAWPVLNNLTVNVVDVGGAEVTLNNSTVVNDLLGIRNIAGVNVNQSTLCGTFVEQLDILAFNVDENPCLK
jgi:hypothetical protein